MQGAIAFARTGPHLSASANSQRAVDVFRCSSARQQKLGARFSSVAGVAVSSTSTRGYCSRSRVRSSSRGVRSVVGIQEQEVLAKEGSGKATTPGPPQTLRGRLVLSKKDLSQLANPGYVEGTADVHLQLVSVEDDANGDLKVSVRASLERITLQPDGSQSPHSRPLMAGEEEYSISFDVPEDFGEVGAFKIWSEYEKEIFIHSFVLTLPDHSTTIEFRCQSWVFNERNYPLERFFFSNKVYLPEDTPAGLRELREFELQVLRGEGPGQRRQQRKLVDRIYDYDTYNDLGHPEHPQGPIIRPPLGGREDLPFPRRLRTGRPRSKIDPRSETREQVPNKQYYIPVDERFPARMARQRTSRCLAYNLKHKTGPKARAASVAAPETVNGNPQPVKMEWESLVEIVSLYRSGSPFPVPTVIAKNDGAWRSDDEYGRQALAGINPQVIKRLEKFPPEGSSITEEHIQRLLKGKSLKEALHLLFTIDHTDEYLPYIERINKNAEKIVGRAAVKAYAPRSLFYWDLSTRKMIPIAIELSLSEGGKVTRRVFTPPHDSGNKDHAWEIAKIHATSIDFSFHEVYSHFVRTHACMEPFVLATNRHLSRLHPIYNFLLPHFKNTLNINSSARQNLIQAWGPIETFFIPGEYSMEMSSKLYGLYWQFNKESLPADLIERGFAKHSDSHPGGVKFLIEGLDYPYAEDGLEIWDALKTYAFTYVNIAYCNDNAVVKDHELQSWWKEIKEVGHGDKKVGWPELKSIANLVHIITTISWIAGPQHAAVNFGQYGYAGFPPNRSTHTREFIPHEGSPGYQELQTDLERFILSTIANVPACQQIMFLLEHLSTHEVDEEYLGQRHDEHWTSDSRVKLAFAELNSALRKIEVKQEERNMNPGLFNRQGSVGVPYTLLYPTSATAGITGQGIPNSISI